MGYTPKTDVDLLGIGMTAISEIGGYFLQNEKRIKSYQSQINETGLAACRGMQLSNDDLMRKWIIRRIICHFYLSFNCFLSSSTSSFNSLIDSISNAKKLEDKY